MIRLVSKRVAQAAAVVLAVVPAALCGFGRWLTVYTFWAQGFALVPGIVGNLLRGAFYRLTLRDSSIDTNIWFGTFFADPESSIAACVSIGSYCVIGSASIGRGTQIASHVGIFGGRHQHARDAGGRLGDVTRARATIGENCWIGESAIVMADVGPGTTIGAGAVVVADIPAGVVAVGNPARVIRTAEAG